MSPERADLAGLSAEELSRRALERARLRKASAASQGIRRRQSDGPLPLSYAQERLWLIDRLTPGNAAFNIPFPARIEGALDVAALCRSLELIWRRQAALRSRFFEQDGAPLQRFDPPGRLSLPVVDLLSLPEEQALAVADRLVRAEAALPFTLDGGLLWRRSLFRATSRRHTLAVTMHHAISDGWSFGVFCRELSSLYQSLVAGQPPTLPEPPIDFGDFVLWQRERLGNAAASEPMSYWRKALAGAPPVLELPTDRPRPQVATNRGAMATLRLDAATVASLDRFCRGAEITLFMFGLAAFQLVLGRLAGQEDVVVGAPSAGRGRTETENLIGFFLNSLVLRTDLSGNPTVAELLARVKKVVLDAYQYQEVPFERLLDELKPERLLSHAPIFQVQFNLFEQESLALRLGETTVEVQNANTEFVKFDLNLYVERMSSGELTFSLAYNRDLFDHERMVELLAQLETVLAQMMARPQMATAELSLLTPAATAVLPDPGRPARDGFAGSLPQKLWAWAESHPDSIAVADEEGELSYGELAQRVRDLASALHGAGLERGEVVAIWAHRDTHLAVAVLAALAAGGAFLILDPAYPSGRLVDYVEIARPRALVVLPNAGAVPAEVEASLTRLPGLIRLLLPLAELSPRVELPELGPEDAACVTFTSGSTGKPKGVVGRHGPLTFFQDNWAQRFGLGSADRFGMLSALSHDPLQRDLFTPLWLGARLEVPDGERLGTPGRMAPWLAERAVSTLHLTPAMMELVADDCATLGLALPHLAHAFVVGDLLKRSEVRRLTHAAPRLEVVNLYGSTETQRSVATFKVDPPGEKPEKEATPLGVGLPGVDLLLLTHQRQRAGIGEMGEIYLRGRHLARGYLEDARLTAQRFLPNPFRAASSTEPAPSDQGGGGTDRLYKTGDLGRYRPDGAVEFAGRADGQVKVRGFRIELGEIEAVLKRQPTVEGVAVVARRNVRGEMGLVAYLTPETGVGRRELREALLATLPDYMVPAVFVRLAALPMTRTGKIDRRALPEPSDFDHAAPGAGETAAHGPRNPIEEMVATHWRDLLGVAEVGVEDDFFALGGHSLLATRLLSRLRAEFGVELPLRALFEAPTVAGLAAAVSVALAGDRPQAAPTVIARPEGAELQLSFQQARLWFLDQLEPGATAYNLSAAVALEGELEVSSLASGLAQVVGRHEALRSVFPAAAGRATVHLLPPARFVVPVVDLDGLETAARRPLACRLAALEAGRSFDLAHGPLLRAVLARLEESSHTLAFSVHHIVADGWSVSVLLAELGAAYGAARAGARWSPPALPLQYPDFAAWQQSWMAGPVLTRQLAFWRQHLSGAPPELELPTDRPRPAERSHRGHRRLRTLPPACRQALAANAQMLGATPFMLLAAAYAAFLSRISHQDDLVVGTPVGGRGDARLEGLIGFFANTLALRFGTHGDPSFTDLVRRVKEEVLAAFTHPDVPFERLVDELAPERSLARSPVFQVMFALQNTPPAELELSGVRVTELPVVLDKSPFDLTLTAFEAAEGLVLRLEAARDLFDGTSVERYLGAFVELLSAALAEPGGAIGALSWLSAAERHQLLREENNSARPLADLERIEELVLAQAARQPLAVAVGFEGRSLTYGELAERAGDLARHLRALGVGPEVKVGFAVERDLGMLVGLLGVLSAGGAYVPLDPNHPQERLAWILESSGITLLLGNPEVLDRLPAVSVPRLGIDRDGGIVPDATTAGTGPGNIVPAATTAGTGPGRFNHTQHSSEAAGPRPGRHVADPENLAYVLYTSGSTGKPKGVEVRHRAVVNFLGSMAEAPGLAAGDTLLAVTTLGFDISVLELFLPLSVGARVELASRETAGDPLRLAALIATSGATVMQATPSTWRLLFEGGWRGTKGLKVLCGGEALPPDLARQLLDSVAELWNVYGPTETTVWSAVSRVDRSSLGERAVELGRPIANTSIALVDARGRTVPRGVSGELLIGGTGLARGYLGRPDLTAARFVPDPDGAQGSRRYRTGDLARRRADGALEYLGRIDAQVKVRGFRIELGEIEIALERRPEVAQAIAAVREDRPGERRLVAYVVAKEETTLDTALLRRALGEVLPDYMVPALLVPMTTLPLNSSGKVDRGALARQPLPAEAENAATFAAPEGPVEAALAEIWAEALGRERLGRHDNFFHLGGDSILAIRIVARAADRGLRFAPRDLFRHQSLAELAPAVDASGLAGGDGAGTLALTPGQSLLLAAGAAAAERVAERVAEIFRVTPPDGVGRESLAAALATLPRLLPALAARFSSPLFSNRAEGGAAELPSSPSPIELAQVGACSREEIEALLLARLSPAEGRLFAAAWAETSPPRLWLAAHPLAVDEASWQPLLSTLAALTENADTEITGAEMGGAPALRAAHLELAALGRGVVAPFERDSWLSLSARPVPRFTRTPDPRPGAGYLRVELSPADTATLEELARDKGLELAELALSALLKALAGWTGSRRQAVELSGDLAERRRLGLGGDIVSALAPRQVVVLEIEDDLASSLAAVSIQARRARRLAVVWGMSPEKDEWRGPAGAPRAEISFRSFEATTPRPGWSAEPLARTPGELALAVTCLRFGGPKHGGPSLAAGLALDWCFDRERLSRQAVDALAVSTLAALRAFASAPAPAAKEAVLAEQFPVAAMSSAELEELLSDL